MLSNFIKRQLNSLMFISQKSAHLEAHTDLKTYHSHYGEDVVLDYIFKNQKSGFYVDIGCYHPEWFSNTYKLYCKGWRGINIDPNIETINLFNLHRSNDINLNLAITEQEGEQDYYKFLEIDSAGGGSGNSLSNAVKDKYEKEGLKANIIKIQTKPLSSILKKYSHEAQIDFLNVDVEGFDLQVLLSNDWKLFRPKVIAIEIWVKDIDYDNPAQNEVYKFLRTQNYKAFSNTINTWFFYDLESDMIVK